MRVLTQLENNVVSAGCGVCGGKQEVDTTPVVAGVLTGLATGAGVAMAGFSAGYIFAGAVLGSAAGVAAPWILANTNVKVVHPT